MTGGSDLQEVYVFLLLARPFLFGYNVLTAEISGNDVIGLAVNQPLPRSRDGKFHRVGFAVVVGYLSGRAAQKLDHGVVAEVELVGALQVNHPGQRDDADYAGLVSGEAERELASGRVPHHDDSG
jgi:hypothetical protein